MRFDSTNPAQAQLDRATAVPVRTLQEWEQSRKVPSGAAQSLLKLVSRHPELADWFVPSRTGMHGVH